MIQDYFKQKTCKHCSQNYQAEGIELIREEPGMVVVRVSCLHCGQPLGIALVGMSNSNPTQSPTAKQEIAAKTRSGFEEDRPYPVDWTRQDVNRLSKAPRITFDDVLDAHEFFSSLDADWNKHLPKRSKSKKTRNPISA